MTSLTPCRACQRHIQDSESACPFCAARQRPRTSPAVIAAALGASLALTACPTRQAPMYGGPPEPPPVSPTANPTNQPDPVPTPTAGPPDDGAPVALYGGPPEPDDSPRNAPEYGAPPPPDAR